MDDGSREAESDFVATQVITLCREATAAIQKIVELTVESIYAQTATARIIVPPSNE